MRTRCVVVALFLAVHLATPVRADQPVRDGLAVGFGLGGASVSWTWPDGERRAERSGSGSLRVAWALDQDLLIGIESWGWSQDYKIGSTPEDIPAEATLWAVTAAATYFPGTTGFYVRGGLGLGGGRAEIGAPTVEKSTATGMSILGAMGYEFGLTPHMALGGAIDAVYIGMDAVVFDQVFGYGFAVQLNWYW